MLFHFSHARQVNIHSSILGPTFVSGPMNHIDKVSDFKKIRCEHAHRSGSKRVSGRNTLNYKNVLKQQ